MHSRTIYSFSRLVLVELRFLIAGMKIYQLDAATRDADTNETIVKDQEAYDLTKWLESGVFEAVELR